MNFWLTMLLIGMSVLLYGLFLNKEDIAYIIIGGILVIFSGWKLLQEYAPMP